VGPSRRRRAGTREFARKLPNQGKPRDLLLFNELISLILATI
jgi:hypothetical protein